MAKVAKIYLPGVGGVGGLTVIILPVSVQVELHWNLPTGTELGNISRASREYIRYF